LSPSLRFPHHNPAAPLLFSIRATCPAHLILFDLITRLIFGEQYTFLSSSLCISLHSPVTLSLLSPNILLITLFSNTLSLRSSLSGSDQVPHPYERPAMEPTQPAIQWGRSPKLNNHFRLVLRIRTAGAVPLLSLMPSCCGQGTFTCFASAQTQTQTRKQTQTQTQTQTQDLFAGYCRTLH